jgi:hypothetical protein
MLSRRTLLASGAACGTATVLLSGASGALAFSAAAPASTIVELHADLIAEAQAALRQDVADGLAAPDVQRSVRCPICCYPLTISMDAAW